MNKLKKKLKSFLSAVLLRYYWLSLYLVPSACSFGLSSAWLKMAYTYVQLLLSWLVAYPSSLSPFIPLPALFPPPSSLPSISHRHAHQQGQVGTFKGRWCVQSDSGKDLPLPNQSTYLTRLSQGWDLISLIQSRDSRELEGWRVRWQGGEKKNEGGLWDNRIVLDHLFFQSQIDKSLYSLYFFDFLHLDTHERRG